MQSFIVIRGYIRGLFNPARAGINHLFTHEKFLL